MSGQRENWTQTVSGKGWVAILRLYSPQILVRPDLAPQRYKEGGLNAANNKSGGINIERRQCGMHNVQINQP
jgi:hypothetical protein